MSEPIGVAELIGIAVNSKQFQASRLMHSVVVAMGWVKGTLAHLGLELTRMRAGLQAKAWRPAEGLLVQELARVRRAQHWLVPDEQLRAMAPSLLHEWLFDVCPVCLGRGIKAIETYHVSDNAVEEVCSACRGTCKSSFRWQDRARAVNAGKKEYDQDWAGRFDTGIAILNAAYGDATDQVGKRLRREVLDS